MTATKKYHIGGLKVLSGLDLEIEESHFTDHDIEIREGRVDFFDKRSNELPRYEFNKEDFFLNVDEIAKFSVHNGESIIVDINKEATSDIYKLFLKGSAWGALLHQRGILPFHASSVEYEGEGVMICGLSGAGKSTLSYNLMQRGANYLCDDITAVKDSYIQPSHVSIKLWKQALRSLNKDHKGLKQIRPEMDKYYFIPEKRNNLAIEIKHIYIIQIDKKSEEVKILSPRGLKKVNILNKQIYRKKFIKGHPEIEKQHTDAIFKLANNSNIRIVRRPDICDINKLTEAVIKDINQQKQK